jgi:hypothetical protein
MSIELRRVNDQLVIVLPEELTASLAWEAGDIVRAEIVEQGLKIVRVETIHSRAMKIARKCMEKYRNTFETLAKS